MPDVLEKWPGGQCGGSGVSDREAGETGFHHISQADHDLLTSGSTLLGLPKCWDYRSEPPRQACVKLVCSVVIIVHCILQLLGSNDPPTSTSQVAGTTWDYRHPPYLANLETFFFLRDRALLCFSDWSQIPGLMQSSHLSLLSSWDHGTLNVSSAHSLLVCKVSAEKSAVSLMKFSFCLACPLEFRLKTAALILTFISSLLACPVATGLTSPYKCVSQHLKGKAKPEELLNRKFNSEKSGP
ncbi:hypothetical protein AAY473_006716 [Plecturocebus cupreus]